MVSRTLIIASVVSIILSIAWIILVYFGCVRYVEMHLRSADTYAGDRYNSLTKASDTNRVVLSLTVSPDRLDKLMPVIKSLLDQTVKVDQIALTVPEKLMKQVPEDVKNYVNVFHTSVNYGYGNGVIPCLLRERDSDTIIVFLQDNQIYNRDLVEKLVDKAEKNPDSVIVTDCYSAVLVRPSMFGPELSETGVCTEAGLYSMLKGDMSSVSGCNIYGAL